MRDASGGRMLGVVVRHAFLAIIAIAALYPLYFIVATAIKTNADYQLDPTGFPSHPSLAALRSIVEDQPLPRWLWNSFLVTLTSVAASTVIAMFAAYAIVFGRFRGHRIFLSTSIALMVVPPVTLLVPMFVFMVDRGWMRQVVLPLAGAATFTLVVVQAIWAWNELLIALVFLQTDEARTLNAGLAQFQGRYSTNQPLILAGALISIAPVVLLYLSGQRFFVRGLTAGIGK
jgi:raffinose/stachyose/melibiose transport system permease protein